MIDVRIFKSGDSYTGFSSEGHAGYAEEGYDIVCSAVSALTITTCNSVESFTDSAFTLDSAEDGGYICLKLKSPYDSEAQLLMKSLELGLKMIEESYGNRFLNVCSVQDEF